MNILIIIWSLNLVLSGWKAYMAYKNENDDACRGWLAALIACLCIVYDLYYIR